MDKDPFKHLYKHKHKPQAHLRFWLLQSSLHCFDLLEVTRHIRGHHHFNDQGSKLPFRDNHGGKRMEVKNGKQKSGFFFFVFATGNQNQLTISDISHLIWVFKVSFLFGINES